MTDVLTTIVVSALIGRTAGRRAPDANGFNNQGANMWQCRAAAAIVVFWFLGACGSAECSATNCAGCCSSSGACLDGSSQFSCGNSGNLCDACVSPQTCSAVTRTCSGAGSNGCTSSAACPNTTDICHSGSCSSGLGRAYRVTLVSVTVPTTDDTGSAWDAFGGAPDLKGCVAIDSAVPVCTSTVDDVFSATWNQVAQVTVTSATKVTVSVYDVDVTTDDYIDGFEWQTGASFLSAARTGGLNGLPYSGAKASWSVRIDAL